MKLQIFITLAFCAASALARPSTRWMSAYLSKDPCGGEQKGGSGHENCMARACTMYLNMQRNQDGKGAMGTGNRAMLQNALDWSRNQASTNNIFHQAIGSVRPGNQCSLMAENVAMFQDPSVINPAAQCAKQWIESPGHYSNMMGPYKYSVCGIILKQGPRPSYYCTQTFSDDCAGGSTAPPTTGPAPEPLPPARPPVDPFSRPRPPMNRPRPPFNPPRPPINRPRPLFTPPTRPQPPRQSTPTLMYKSVTVMKDGRRIRMVRVCREPRYNRFRQFSQFQQFSQFPEFSRYSPRRQRGSCRYCRPNSRNRCLSPRASRMLDRLLSQYFY